MTHDSINTQAVLCKKLYVKDVDRRQVKCHSTLKTLWKTSETRDTRDEDTGQGMVCLYEERGGFSEVNQNLTDRNDREQNDMLDGKGKWHKSLKNKFAYDHRQFRFTLCQCSMSYNGFGEEKQKSITTTTTTTNNNYIIKTTITIILRINKMSLLSNICDWKKYLATTVSWSF